MSGVEVESESCAAGGMSAERTVFRVVFGWMGVSRWS